MVVTPTALEFVTEYVKKEYGTEEDRVIFDLLQDNIIWSEDLHSSRWWNNTFEVSNINGVLIGWNGANTTGDDRPQDKGWDFDKNSICYVESVTETITVTKYKKI